MSLKVFAQRNHIISKGIQTCKKYSDTHCYKQYYTKRRIKRLSQSVKKGTKDYISNYYSPSNKRHQISFFVNDTCSDYQCHFCCRHFIIYLTSRSKRPGLTPSNVIKGLVNE